MSCKHAKLFLLTAFSRWLVLSSFACLLVIVEPVKMQATLDEESEAESRFREHPAVLLNMCQTFVRIEGMARW